MEGDAFECMLEVDEDAGMVTFVFHQVGAGREAEGFGFGLDQVKNMIRKLQAAVFRIEGRAARRQHPVDPGTYEEGPGRLFFFGKEGSDGVS